MAKSSRISGFHKLSISERLDKVKEFAHLSDEEASRFQSRALDLSTADRMIENVIGTFEIPVGIVTNMIMLGFFTAVTGVVSRRAVEKAIETTVKAKTVPLNLEAFDKGYEYQRTQVENKI